MYDCWEWLRGQEGSGGKQRKTDNHTISFSTRVRVDGKEGKRRSNIYEKGATEKSDGEKGGVV